MTGSTGVGGTPQDRPPVLVIGPGWLGEAIAVAFESRGHLVWTASRRRRDADARGHRALAIDVTDEDAAETLAGSLPPGMGGIVLAVAPDRARGDSHASTYPAAARTAAAVADRCGARTLLYTSSTGVYGVTDGSVVTEATPADARDDRTRALMEAEERVLAAAVPARVVLRVAGLYGPGRDPAARFRAQHPIGPDDDHWTNFAWRDDVVAATTRLLQDGPDGAHVFNVSDGTPVRASEIASRLSASAPSDVATHRPAHTRGSRSNQRVDSGRLRGTGWSPRMRTVFDGLRALGHDVGSALPYGPATARIRRFLVALAALGPAQRAEAVARFAQRESGASYRSADQALAAVVERSGRGDARDALAGPLLQLVRTDDVLDAVAAPALSALLALLVEDLLPSDQFAALYGSVDGVIPRASLDSPR